MRIALNARTEAALLEIMQHLEIANPTHCLNVLVTDMHKQITQQSQPHTIPKPEDSIHVSPEAPTH